MELKLNAKENLLSPKKNKTCSFDKNIIISGNTQTYSKKKSTLNKITDNRKNNRYNSYKRKRNQNNQILHNPKLDENKKILFFHLLIEPEERTKSQIEYIKNYLLKNTPLIENLNKTIGNVFHEKSKDIFDIDAVINEFCRSLKFKNIYYGNKIFRIGECEDNMYFILEGLVEIVKPEKFKIQMNGFEYFTYLMRLKRDNEKYLIQLIFDCKNKFVINKEDLKNLNYIFLYIKLTDYFRNNENNKYISKSEITNIIKSCFCDPEYILRNCDDENNIDEEILDQIEFKISDDIINFYYSMAIDNEQCDVYLYKYSSVKHLKNGGVFGEPVNNKKNLREYTVNTLEDCYFGYLEVKQYYKYLKLEKEQKIKEKSNFLLNNFFFGNVNEDIFNYRYLSLFLYEEKSQCNSIINQKDKIDYIYFIKEGTVELMCSHSVYSSYDLLVKVHTNIINLNLNEISEYLFEKNRNKRETLENEYTKLINTPLVIKNSNSIIALESFFFDLNSLYNTRITSQKISYYKLSVNSFNKILKENKDIIGLVKEKATSELKIIVKRLLAALNIRIHNIQIKEEDINNSKVKSNDDNKISGNFNNSFIENEKMKKKYLSDSSYEYKKNKNKKNANFTFNDFNNKNKKNKINNVNSSINDESVENNILSISVKNELNLVNKLQHNLEKNLLFFKSHNKTNSSKVSNNSFNISNIKNLEQQSNLNNISFFKNNNMINFTNKNCQTEKKCNNIISKIKNKNSILQHFYQDKISNEKSLPIIISTEKSNCRYNPCPLLYKAIKTNNLTQNNDKINNIMNDLNEDNSVFCNIERKQNSNNFFNKGINRISLKKNHQLINETNNMDFDKLPASYIQFLPEQNEENENDYSAVYGQGFRQGKVKSIKSYKNKKWKYNVFKSNYFKK